MSDIFIQQTLYYSIALQCDGAFLFLILFLIHLHTTPRGFLGSRLDPTGLILLRIKCGVF